MGGTRATPRSRSKLGAVRIRPGTHEQSVQESRSAQSLKIRDGTECTNAEENSRPHHGCSLEIDSPMRKQVPGPVNSQSHPTGQDLSPQSSEAKPQVALNPFSQAFTELVNEVGAAVASGVKRAGEYSDKVKSRIDNVVCEVLEDVFTPRPSFGHTPRTSKLSQPSTHAKLSPPSSRMTILGSSQKDGPLIPSLNLGWDNWDDEENLSPNTNCAKCASLAELEPETMTSLRRELEEIKRAKNSLELKCDKLELENRKLRKRDKARALSLQKNHGPTEAHPPTNSTETAARPDTFGRSRQISIADGAEGHLAKKNIMADSDGDVAWGSPIGDRQILQEISTQNVHISRKLLKTTKPAMSHSRQTEQSPGTSQRKPGKQTEDTLGHDSARLLSADKCKSIKEALSPNQVSQEDCTEMRAIKDDRMGCSNGGAKAQDASDRPDSGGNRRRSIRLVEALTAEKLRLDRAEKSRAFQTGEDAAIPAASLIDPDQADVASGANFDTMSADNDFGQCVRVLLPHSIERMEEDCQILKETLQNMQQKLQDTQIENTSLRVETNLLQAKIDLLEWQKGSPSEASDVLNLNGSPLESCTAALCRVEATEISAFYPKGTTGRLQEGSVDVSHSPALSADVAVKARLDFECCVVKPESLCCVSENSIGISLPSA